MVRAGGCRQHGLCLDGVGHFGGRSLRELRGGEGDAAHRSEQRSVYVDFLIGLLGTVLFLWRLLICCPPLPRHALHATSARTPPPPVYVRLNQSSAVYVPAPVALFCLGLACTARGRSFVVREGRPLPCLSSPRSKQLLASARAGCTPCIFAGIRSMGRGARGHTVRVPENLLQVVRMSPLSAIAVSQNVLPKMTGASRLRVRPHVRRLRLPVLLLRQLHHSAGRWGE